MTGKPADKTTNRLFEPTPVVVTSERMEEDEEKSAKENEDSQYLMQSEVHTYKSPFIKACERLSWLTIHPHSMIALVWQAIVSILLLYTGTLFPMRLAFYEFHILTENEKALEEPYAWKILGQIVDILFWIDLGINFISAYYNRQGDLIDNPAVIGYKYLRGWFLLDLIACLPPDLFSKNSSANKSLRLPRLYRIFRLTRLTRLMKLGRTVKIVKVLLQFGVFRTLGKTRGARIAKFIVVLFFSVHLLACGWYLLAAMHSEYTDTWVFRRDVGEMQLIDEPPSTQWLHAMYFILTVFTTVGFGDIYPVSNAEIIYSLIVMLIGAVVHSIIVSEMINVVTAVDDKAAEKRRKKALIESFSLHAQLGEDNLQKMQRYLDHESENSPVKYDRQEMQGLLMNSFFPSSILEQLPKAAFGGLLLRNSMFSCGPGCKDLRLLLLVSVHLNRRTHGSGEYVYQYNDFPANVYMILKGTFAAVGYPSPEGGMPDVSINPISLFPMHEVSKPNTPKAAGGPTHEKSKKNLALKIIGGRDKDNTSGSAAGKLNTSGSAAGKLREEASVGSNIGSKHDSSGKLQGQGTNGQYEEIADEPIKKSWPYQLYSIHCYFGESELLFSSTRKTSMRSEAPGGITVSLARRPFNFIISEFPKFRDGLRQKSRRREERRQKNLLKLTEAASASNLAAITIQRFLRGKLRAWKTPNGSQKARRESEKEDQPSQEFSAPEVKKRAQYAIGPHPSISMPSLLRFTEDAESPMRSAVPSGASTASPRKDYQVISDKAAQAQIHSLEEKLTKVQHESTRHRDELRRGQEEILRSIQDLAQAVHALSLDRSSG